MYMIAGVSQYVAVASFMEAWIEMPYKQLSFGLENVASFMEAWIEIVKNPNKRKNTYVASFMEAWIEIIKILKN